MKENTINEIFYFFALNCVEENSILEEEGICFSKLYM